MFVALSLVLGLAQAADDGLYRIRRGIATVADKALLPRPLVA